MSSLARIAAMSILLFAVGVGLGLVDAGTVDAQPGNGGQRLTPRPGAQLVLEIDRPASERGPVRSAQPLHAEDGAAQQLYDEIMREADHALGR
jgi:hypothetical protein